MQEAEIYVRQFQEQMSQRNKHKQPWQYPDDTRLHERPRVRKIEPPSQILSQQILRNSNYVPESLTNFTKPLINYQITSPANKEPQRYNHNYTYLGKDNIFRKEPYNQPQKDYNRYSQQQFNENRVNYQNVGNMLVGDNQNNQNNQNNHQRNSNSQQQFNSQSQVYGNDQQKYQSYNEQQKYQQVEQQKYQQVDQQKYQSPPQQQQPQQYYQYQAGSPNLYKLKSDSNHQNFNYYGSRALKNLDSTQIY